MTAREFIEQLREISEATDKDLPVYVHDSNGGVWEVVDIKAVDREPCLILRKAGTNENG